MGKNLWLPTCLKITSSDLKTEPLPKLRRIAQLARALLNLNKSHASLPPK
jgi:hypothetical protein